MAKFSVGEIVELISSVIAPEFIGRDVTVLSELTYVPGGEHIDHCITTNAHLIKYPDGRNMWASPEVLRKKQPPKENKDITLTRKSPISWDECEWSPERVEA